MAETSSSGTVPSKEIPHWQTSEYPAELDPPQLTVQLDLFTDQTGGCAARFSVREGSELVTAHGAAGTLLAACRDEIVAALDSLIEVSRDG